MLLTLSSCFHGPTLSWPQTQKETSVQHLIQKSLTCKLQKKCPICGYTWVCFFLLRTAEIPFTFPLLSLVIRMESSRSKWRAKSQKHALRAKPPSTNMLKPLMPKSAASPWPPGNTYSVGWLNRMFPTTSDGSSNCSNDVGRRNGLM